MDTAGGRTSRPALHHPHLYGPANHCGHHQPQGAQAQGQTCLCAVWWCYSILNIFSSFACGVYPSLDILQCNL